MRIKTMTMTHIRLKAQFSQTGLVEQRLGVQMQIEDP
jgi:hypothetical protein